MLPAIIPDLLPPALLARVLADFPPEESPVWLRYDEPCQRKRVCNQIVTEAIGELYAWLSAPAFIDRLGGLSGVRGLLWDDSLWGAGLSLMGPGDLLGLHRDLEIHPHTGLERRVNVCLSLTHAPEGAGGALQVCSDRIHAVRRQVPGDDGQARRAQECAGPPRTSSPASRHAPPTTHCPPPVTHSFPPRSNQAVVFDPATSHCVSPLTGAWRRRCVQVFYYTPAPAMPVRHRRNGPEIPATSNTTRPAKRVRAEFYDTLPRSRPRSANSAADPPGHNPPALPANESRVHGVAKISGAKI